MTLTKIWIWIFWMNWYQKVTQTGRLGQKQFQSGIIVTIKSIKQLYNDLKKEGIHYLLTSRTNQDCLENSFSTLRFMGGSNAHPTANEFCERLRMLCVSKSVNYVIMTPSVEYHDSSQFISAEILDIIHSNIRNETISPQDCPY